MAKVYGLTHEMLTDLLDYDPATGIFVWRVARSNRVKVGSRAGVFHKASGGRYISIGDEKVRAHRLAFFYMNKRWPNTDVRPLDGNYDNCAVTNLQEISRVELAHQRDIVATNTSGFAGVSRAKYGKWQAKITWNYKQINLGASFVTADEASEMYEEALRRLRASLDPNLDPFTVVAEVRLWMRQKTAWRNVERSHPDHTWASFEAFCLDIKDDVPTRRFAMAPIDAARPIGPENFKWSLPFDSEISTRDGRVAYNRANREGNRNHHRDRDFRKKYGIDFAEYQRMLTEQNGVCAICEHGETKMQNGVVQMLAVDHHHGTGKVRALLCSNCNYGLGSFRESPDTLRKAIAYLRKHGAESDNVQPFKPAVVGGILGNGA